MIYPLIEDRALSQKILDDLMTYLADNQNVLRVTRWPHRICLAPPERK